MSLCPSCGLELFGVSAEVGLCVHHLTASGDVWAGWNKTFCDWLHRRVEPPNVPLTDPPPVEWSDVG